MIEIDLENVSFSILGVKKSGKSTLADIILRQYAENALYYDTLGEASVNAPYDFYKPLDRYSVDELESVIHKITPKKGQDINLFDPPYKMFIIDECNRFCPPRPKPLPASVGDLNDQNRHYKMSVGYIARRPSQLHSDLIELADYIFIFRLTGKADRAYLNALVSGLGEVVAKLENHAFVLVYPDKHYQVCNPLKPVNI